ncbi:MAG: adenine nucleotide alpha hydrolase [Oscillospiraceae bacterium]|nr:adenine nucleotide alpha hydrolase [Oscillospiraceae bacterium]
MIDLSGKKFVASYSGGKDSILAVHRAIKAGLVPIGLITTYNSDADRSWFHGMSEELLQSVSDSLRIPLKLIQTTGDSYAENFEAALMEAKAAGAEVCIFGDIDIEGHFDWCLKRCENTGLEAWFPLRDEPRKAVVYEFLDAGFSAVIKIVDTARVSDSFLGKTLTKDVVDEIERGGADICGENGEYHTFVYDGPLFSSSVKFIASPPIQRDSYLMIDLALE